MRFLGIIAEDQSDVDVAHELARKVARKEFTVRRILGHGCGRISAKARAWAAQLNQQGCTLLVLICDLDRRRLDELSKSLLIALHPCPIQQSIVVIPVREIEAWLLADHDAITRALKLPRPLKKQPNPEAIQNPKERLRDLIRERSKGHITYLNTVHNVKIAKHIQVQNLDRCPAFSPFETFIRTNLG